MGSFHVQENSYDKTHSPFANVSTDSDSAKSTSSANDAYVASTIQAASQIGKSQFAVLAYNARRAKEHQAKMEFLDKQVAEIKKKKSVCTVF
jgi:hypothetical protein